MIDNRSQGKVYNEIKEKINSNSKLSIISAYFTIYAFDALKKELSQIDSLRFIFTEPSFLKENKPLSKEFEISRNPSSGISGNEFEIKLRNEMNQAYIARECANWIKNKVQFKSFIHSNPAQQRMIHINNNGDNNLLINGSVDFTTDGLGFTNSNRIDLNTCLYGKENTQSYLELFENVWNDSSLVKDVKQDVLEHMHVIFKENSPRYIYFITLYNIFSGYLDELTEDNFVKTQTGFKETNIWNMLYKFQKDGVLGAISKIEKYNGCIIADSVGLGKTFEALAIIKYYELRNDRVLVLCPKKLRDNWTVFTQNDKRNILVDDRFNYDVLNHTDLSRYKGYSGEINLKTINWSNYDLIVIDESHNFRNNNTRTNKVTRYARLMNEILRSGVKTKVLMLSATPVNNRMNDIKNQIAFITEGVDNAFIQQGIPSIELTLKKSQQIFNQWLDFDEDKRTTDAFIEMIGMDYFKLLDLVTLARSRKHIEKYYDTNEVGEFPKRMKPINVKADIDLSNGFPELREVNKIIKNLNLAVYSPLLYVLPEKRVEYSQKYDKAVKDGSSVFKQTDREKSLISLMRVNILKRLESSIFAFSLTIERLVSKIDVMLDKIENQQEIDESNLSINEIDVDDEILADLMIGDKVKVLLKDLDLVKWKQNLEEDRENLGYLLEISSKVDSLKDAKLEALKEEIRKKVQNTINPNNKKVMLFTAFSDTANYLYDNLTEWFNEEFGLYSALVTGSGNNKSNMPHIPDRELNTILTNFSPHSKYRDKVYPEMTDEIDLLIGTDCISEGQNLQDCDFLINYDIHWNPVRIIQRFGRIDRIGSKNEQIQLVNFWPNLDLDEYIQLESRVRGRMVLLDISATGEENIISFDETKEMNDLQYRKKQLLQLQDEVMDIEDISGGISITDLTLNDFKMDLMEFMKEHRKELEEAPLGMYSIVDIPDELSNELEAGVIFTVQQVNHELEAVKQNVLYPYYLIYISQSGKVKLNFLHSKKILDYFKKLCSNKDEVLHNLVEIFNKETKDGKNMQAYSELLNLSLDNIMGKKEEVGVASLFSKGVLP